MAQISRSQNSPSSFMFDLDQCCDMIGCLEMPGGWNRAKVGGNHVGDKTNEIARKETAETHTNLFKTPLVIFCNIPYEVYQPR